MAGPHRRSLTSILVLLLALVVVGGVGTLARGEDDVRQKADEFFEKKNYAEAVTLYEAMLAATEDLAEIQHATSRLVAC